jgi:hypothetical protein
MAGTVEPQKLVDVFSNWVFRIPDYQRGYAWEEKQLQDLIQDIELLPEGHSHFMGMLVIQPTIIENGASREQLILRDKGDEPYAVYDVIDGQQRLTTLVLLLFSIAEEMEKIDLDRANKIRERYIAVVKKPGLYFTRLQLSLDNQKFFENNVLKFNQSIEAPTIRSQRLILNAIDSFKKYLELKKIDLGTDYPKWLQEKQRVLTEQLKLIVYLVEDKVDAEVIFETLNDRGKPLTELEKVKNYLIHLASKLEDSYSRDLREKINDTWAHIFRRLDEIAEERSDDHEDRLLRSHWLMVYNPNPDTWRQSRSIKDYLKLTGNQEDLYENIKYYLTTLRNSASAYRDIYLPKHLASSEFSQENLQDCVILSEKLNRLGARASFIPVLLAARLFPGVNGGAYRDTLELAEKYFFRVYEWAGYRGDTGQSRLYSLAHNYFVSQDTDNMLLGIRQAIHNYCSNERFIERFKSETENWYEWGGIRYFLYEYEVDKRGGRAHITWETLNHKKKEETVEHVLPQTLPDISLQTYWHSHFDQTKHKRWINDIGNLTLTFDNSSLGNRPFPEKCGVSGQQGRYAGSPLIIENEIAFYPDWTEKEIQERRKKIEEWAIGRWDVEEVPEDESEENDSIEAQMQKAEGYQYLDAFRDFHNATMGLNFNARVRANIQYRPPFNWLLSVLTVQINPGGLWVYVRLHNFAKFKNMNREKVDRIIGGQSGWRWRQIYTTLRRDSVN